MHWLAAAGPHISIKADEIINLGGLSITNSQLLGLLGLVVLVWLMFRLRLAALGRRSHTVATRLVAWVFESLLHTVEQVIPDKV